MKKRIPNPKNLTGLQKLGVKKRQYKLALNIFKDLSASEFRLIAKAHRAITGSAKEYSKYVSSSLPSKLLEMKLMVDDQRRIVDELQKVLKK